MMRTEPLLPAWIPSTHALHLSQAVQQRIRREYDPHSIFLNIPYSERYTSLEVAILSTVTAYDLTPRLARERRRMETRLLRIVELMFTCRFGLTDLSYVHRMNMPLELGLLLGFGKESFVMSGKRYGALRTISDLNFTDIFYHEGRVRQLIQGLSLWIEHNCSSKRITLETLLRRYRRFRRIRRTLGENFDRLRPQEIKALVEVAQDEFQITLPGS